jgi:hypothetical protein
MVSHPGGFWKASGWRVLHVEGPMIWGRSPQIVGPLATWRLGCIFWVCDWGTLWLEGLCFVGPCYLLGLLFVSLWLEGLLFGDPVICGVCNLCVCVLCACYLWVCYLWGLILQGLLFVGLLFVCLLFVCLLFVGLLFVCCVFYLAVGGFEPGTWLEGCRNVVTIRLCVQNNSCF